MSQPNNNNRRAYAGPGGSVFVASSRNTFPHPAEFTALSLHNPADVRIWRNAPWYDRAALEDPCLVNRYLGPDLRFPDGTPSNIACSFDWTTRCCLSPRDVQRRDMDRYIRLVMRRLFRLPHPMVPIDVHGATDAYCYYRNADVPYVRRLMRLSELGLFHTWDGIAARVHSSALCVEFPVLDAGFRFQTESAHDRTARKWERRVRVRDGLLVPYANAEFESLTRTARARVYVALPPRWDALEVPPHFYVGTPRVVWYYGSELMRSPSSPYWIVFYTEFTVLAAKHLLIEMYSRFRLWRVSPLLLNWMRRLDLSSVLGSRRNAAELTAVLDLIEGVDWSSLSQLGLVEPKKGKRRHIDALGRSRCVLNTERSVAEFAFFDPWRREFLASQACVNARAFPPIPANHPTGLVSCERLPNEAIAQLAHSLVPGERFDKVPGSNAYVAVDLGESVLTDLSRDFNASRVSSINDVDMPDVATNSQRDAPVQAPVLESPPSSPEVLNLSSLTIAEPVATTEIALTPAPAGVSNLPLQADAQRVMSPQNAALFRAMNSVNREQLLAIVSHFNERVSRPQALGYPRIDIPQSTDVVTDESSNAPTNGETASF